MLPQESSYDFIDVARLQIKQPCDVALSEPKSEKVPDFSYIFGRQFCAAMGLAMRGWLSKDVITVKKIFRISAIFQVAVSIIRFNAVLVVNLVFAWNWLKKSFRYEFVRHISAFDVLSTETDLEITVLSDSGHNESHLFSPRRNLSSKTSEIRYGIEPFITSNWLPNFGRGVIEWIGHNFVHYVLAPPSVDPQSGVNLLYGFIEKFQRQIV